MPFESIKIIRPLVICEAAPPEGLDTILTDYAMCPFCGLPLAQHAIIRATPPPPIPIKVNAKSSWRSDLPTDPAETEG